MELRNCYAVLLTKAVRQDVVRALAVVDWLPLVIREFQAAMAGGDQRRRYGVGRS